MRDESGKSRRSIMLLPLCDPVDEWLQAFGLEDCPAFMVFGPRDFGGHVQLIAEILDIH